MAKSHGGDEAGCTRKRPREPRDVELIDLVEDQHEATVLQQSQQVPFSADEEPCLSAWSKKRTNTWVKDATHFLDLEASNGAADEALDASVNAQEDVAKADFHVNIPLNRMLHSYAEYREKCIVCYDHMKALNNADMEQWISADDASRPAVEQAWPLGHGFFAIKFTSKSAATKALSDGKMPFNDGFVHVVPYIPCFFPADDVGKKHVPVWVSFPHIPLFLKSFLHEIASGLGKVLHIPQQSSLLSSITPRVCVLWEVRREAPEHVKVSFDQLGAMKIAMKFETTEFPVASSSNGNSEAAKDAAKEALPLLLPAPSSPTMEPIPMQIESSPTKNSVPSSPRLHVPKPDNAKMNSSPVSTHQTNVVPSLSLPAHMGPPFPHALFMPMQQYEWGPNILSTTYDNALFQYRKSKSTGKELAIASHHHAMKEVSSNSRHTLKSSRKSALLKYASSYGGKENCADRKDDKERSAWKDYKDDKEKNIASKDPKSVSTHNHTPSISSQLPETNSSKAKTVCPSPLLYDTSPK